MTFTSFELGKYTVYVNDDTNKVHHAVDYNSSNPRTLYPYEPGKYEGLDNVCGIYTLRQIRNRLNKGTIYFR